MHFQRVCLKDSRWLPEISFDFGCKSGRLIEDVYIPPYSVRGGKTKFDSWSVIVLVDDKEEKEQVRNELVQRNNSAEMTLYHSAEIRRVGGISVLSILAFGTLVSTLEPRHVKNTAEILHPVRTVGRAGSRRSESRQGIFFRINSHENKK